jgi:hypothetical protein
VAGWLSRIETELTVDEGVREEDIAGIFAAGTVGQLFLITRKGRRDKTILRSNSQRKTGQDNSSPRTGDFFVEGQENTPLKGQCHEIFCFPFFS